MAWKKANKVGSKIISIWSSKEFSPCKADGSAPFNARNAP